MADEESEIESDVSKKNDVSKNDDVSKENDVSKKNNVSKKDDNVGDNNVDCKTEDETEYDEVS